VLIAKGNRVKFILKDDTGVPERGTVRGSMLHDPTGKSWPKNSLLVTSFNRSGRLATDAEKRGAPKEYLGRTHAARVGSVNLPPKALSEWTYVGELKTILYVRPGRKAPGAFYHHFGQRRIEAFWKKGRAHLYRLGSAYRVQLGNGALADDRGIVHP
jgi:hypothetical protein